MKKMFSILLAVMILAMTVIPAAAASNSFVPSIEGKYSPKIILQTDSKGNSAAAIIYDKDGHEITGVPESAVIITPLSGTDDAANVIKEALDYAQKQIKDADNLGDLTDEVNAYLKENYPEISLDDLVVSQLFDVRLDDKYSKYLNDGAYFNVQLDFGESFLFFLLSQDKAWTLCKDYKVDGSVVTLNLSEPTQVALVKSNYSPSGVPSDKNNSEVKSPQTGDYANVLLISLGVLSAVGAALFIVMFARNKHTKKEN